MFGSSPRSAHDIFDDLERLQSSDVDWRSGRVFSLAYFAGDEVLGVAERAHTMFASANGLNMDAFPSLRRMQSDVVGTVTRWLHGDSQAAGFMTSGGTESILLAVEGARQRGRAERSITRPNVVLPTSAHAAFEKACSYFDVESRRVDVGSDWRADPEAMSAAVDDHTVLLVASAPQYPQGVIDPVHDIGAIGLARGINVHVDACMGGVTLPFLERAGYDIAPWDFRVPGVTSISVDLHKYGYTSKGASVLVHANRELRGYHTFVTDNWLGGLYGSSGILGTKSGGPIAAAWAVMSFLGDEGYEELARVARRTCLRLAEAIETIDGLELRARPDSTLVSFGSNADIDVMAIADRLKSRSWYVDRQSPPPSLHCTIHAGHAATIEAFIADVRECTLESATEHDTGSSAAYGTIE
jgi:glutamate/tyrosine decarboxylase-like PLP-dependent enzyme